MGRPTQHAHCPFSPFVGGRAIRVRYAIPEPHTPPAGRGVAARDRVAAVIAAGTRPDLPFRTRKLRLPAPMVLHPPGCGRVGHRRPHHKKRGGPPSGPPFLVCPRLFSAGHRTPGTTPPDAADNHHTARRRHRQRCGRPPDTPADRQTPRQTTNTHRQPPTRLPACSA